MASARMKGYSNDPQVMAFLGFILGSVTVGVMVYLGLRSRQKGPLGALNIYNVTGRDGLPAGVQAIQPSLLADAMQLSDGTSLTTKADTVRLTTTQPSRVFTAPGSGPMWRVRLSVIGPAGAFAVLAIDTLPDPSGSQALILPSSGQTTLLLGPRQSISGIARNLDTSISYSASAEVV